MKFGKRLAAEAARRWRPFYLDYKAVKRAIRRDVACKDPTGRHFEDVLKLELKKICAFYVDKEEELRAIMQRLAGKPPAALSSFRAEVQDLKKYVVLNYIAVIKAVKKRNRLLKDVCGEQTVVLRAVNVLSHQYFFTSPRLAALATEAEVLAKELLPSPNNPDVLAEYQCPICLTLLQTPVVLTCAHRFCWGCLLAHCASVMTQHARQPGANGQDVLKDAVPKAVAPQALVSEESDQMAVATFDCPVCRKPHILDLDRLQVDPNLNRFIEGLRVRSTTATTTLSSSSTTETSTLHFPPPPARHIGDLRAVRTLPDVPEEQPESEEFTFLAQVAAPDTPPEATSDAALEDLSAATAVPMIVEALPMVEVSPMVETAETAPMAEVVPMVETAETAPMAEVVPMVEAPADKTGPQGVQNEVQAASTRCAAGCSRAQADVVVVPPAVVVDVQVNGDSSVKKAPELQTEHNCLVASTVAEATCETAVVHDGPAPLLPPQPAHLKGRMTVVLDLDGTLVSSYTPRRAPTLAPGAIGYLVGRGARLNPNGVFVVERPGLKAFFERITAFAEVVLFTAGLEDYARPIADALEKRYKGCFSARLYRPSTVSCEVYPCIKDMSRLGRDLRRTVLVDDTPLAFYFQPNNGIPVYNFRADPDDRILLEAVAPMLESLSAAEDLRPLLYKKFNMPGWFMVQGLPVELGNPVEHKGVCTIPRPRAQKTRSSPALPASRSAPTLSTTNHGTSSTLLLCDFDKTITDHDAGESLVGELAPELVPLLQSLEMPANFIPITNSVLSEMQRRGVSRDKLLSTLHSLGAQIPQASADMLRWANKRGLDVRILSDCNSVFIAHILSGAKLSSAVNEVLTNFASFERVEEGSYGGYPASGRRLLSDTLDATFRPPPHRLVIHPRHPYQLSKHGCPLCPENLCKGAEVRKLRKLHRFDRIIYCGDGANDLCPALELGSQDVVLARRGHSLERLIKERRNGGDGVRQVVAAVKVWDDHDDMFFKVQTCVNK